MRESARLTGRFMAAMSLFACGRAHARFAEVVGPCLAALLERAGGRSPSAA